MSVVGGALVSMTTREVLHTILHCAEGRLDVAVMTMQDGRHLHGAAVQPRATWSAGEEDMSQRPCRMQRLCLARWRHWQATDDP